MTAQTHPQPFYIGIGRVSDPLAQAVAGHFGFGDRVFNFSSQKFKGGEANSRNFLLAPLDDHPDLPILTTDQRQSIADGISGAHVVLVQSVSGPNADTRSMTLMQRVRHTKNVLGAGRVSVILTKCGYDRSDRSFVDPIGNPDHNAIGVDTFALGLKSMGADDLVAFDLHSRDAMDILALHFGSAVTFPSAIPLVAQHLCDRFKDSIGGQASSIVIGAPDGADKPNDQGQARALLLAEAFARCAGHGNVPLPRFYIGKKRTSAEDTHVISFASDVPLEGKTAIIIDDLTDSGGTLLNAARELKARGAARVIACVVHGTLVGDALQKLITELGPDNRPLIDDFIVTDSVPGVLEKIERFGFATDPRVTCVGMGPAVIGAIEHLTT